jgi:hypothetical protein
VRCAEAVSECFTDICDVEEVMGLGCGSDVDARCEFYITIKPTQEWKLCAYDDDDDEYVESLVNT